MLAVAVALAALLHLPPPPTPTAPGVAVAAAPVRHPETSTPIGDVELALVLREAHADVFGHPPPARRLAGVWALARLEGSRVGWCHNLGSVGATGATPYCIHGGRRHAWAPTHREGAARLWRVLRQSYSGALARFDAGDVDGAAGVLARAGYHRADPEVYRRGLRTLSYQYARDAGGPLAAADAESR